VYKCLQAIRDNEGVFGITDDQLKVIRDQANKDLTNAITSL